MNKYSLPIIFISTILLSSCGGGGSNSPATDPTDPTYNPYAGTGIGDKRLKQSISSNGEITTYSYLNTPPRKGKLEKIEHTHIDNTVDTITNEYEAVGGKLSKYTDVSTTDNIVNTQTLTFSYGATSFKEPLIAPVISSSTFLAEDSKCGALNGNVEYTYNMDKNNITAISLAKAQLTGEMFTDKNCSKSNVTLDRLFTYDPKGRLKTEITKVVETNYIASSIAYEYDTSDKLKKVTEVLAPGNNLVEETSVSLYAQDSQGRTYATTTTETITSTGSQTITNHIYEDGPCFYHYLPNMLRPSGEGTMGLCPR